MRNLKRLLALTAVVLLTLAIAMSPDAGAYGALIVVAGASFGVFVWARPPGYMSENYAHQSKNTAPDFLETGQRYQLMPGSAAYGSGGCSSFYMNSGAPPNAGTRKRRFAVSMAFHGDRICTKFMRSIATAARGAPAGGLLLFTSNVSHFGTYLFEKFRSIQSKAINTMKASPPTSWVCVHFGKLTNFGLTHYRARDMSRMALGLAT